MNISDEIYDLLSEKEFQNPNSGLLFFPVYVYTYPPEMEFKAREQINSLNERLKRPTNSLNCLVVNIYEEFINYMKEYSFAGESYLDRALNLESTDYKRAYGYLDAKIHGDEFIQLIGEKFKSYFENQTEDKVYLLLYGFGAVYPYLRLSELLKNLEQYVKRYKLIAFYPGEYKNENYSLFGILNDDNVYRASHLNELIP